MADATNAGSPSQTSLQDSENGNTPSDSQDKPPAEWDGRIERTSVKILFDWSDQALNVPIAFAKNPNRVRKELVEAIRHVELEESDLRLLMVECAVKAALRKPNSVTAEQILHHVETYQNGDTNSLGALFYGYGRNYGLTIFFLATNADPDLLARLEDLPRQDQVLLIRRLTEEPPRNLSKLLTECDIYEAQKSVAKQSTDNEDPQSGLNIIQSSPSALENFNYSQLPVWADFRLVLLERASQTNEVRCHLIPAASKEHFDYEALSYTWGAASEDLQDILINGKRFKVTRNLHLALKRLRHGGSGKYRCLWIDRLCIDQSNGTERNRQVSQMGRIYRNAQKVLVWLGEHSSDSDQAINFVTTVFKSSRVQQAMKTSGYVYDGIREYKASDWHAVDSLFRRDYWERTWIIQEIQLARSVLIHCGDRTFDWTAGSAFFDFVQGDRDRHLETDLQSVVTKQKVMQTPAIQLLETALVFQKRIMTLKQLLYRHENSLCRENRDKVYGLLALASDCKDRKFEPDYDKDISRIWRDALGLEMTGYFSGEPISADLVHYSHFLQRILKIWLPGPDLIPVTMPRDPVCILGYSVGSLEASGTEQEMDVHQLFRAIKMFDSEFLIHKGPDPPQTNLFGDLLDPTKGPMSYLWIDMLDFSQEISSTSGENKVLTSIEGNASNSEPPSIKKFELSNGQIVITPDVAQEGDEICMFSKHDLAIVLRVSPTGNWQVICNALVLASDEKKNRRPREELRNFRYCVPDYDIFPPPTSSSQNSFYIRMSTRSLQWMTRLARP